MEKKNFKHRPGARCLPPGTGRRGTLGNPGGEEKTFGGKTLAIKGGKLEENRLFFLE